MDEEMKKEKFTIDEEIKYNKLKGTIFLPNITTLFLPYMMILAVALATWVFREAYEMDLKLPMLRVTQALLLIIEPYFVAVFLLMFLSILSTPFANHYLKKRIINERSRNKRR